MDGTWPDSQRVEEELSKMNLGEGLDVKEMVLTMWAVTQTIQNHCVVGDSYNPLIDYNPWNENPKLNQAVET